MGCAPRGCRNHFQFLPRDLRTSAVSHELRLLHIRNSPFKVLNQLRSPWPWRNPQIRLPEFRLSAGQMTQPTNVGGDGRLRNSSRRQWGRNPGNPFTSLRGKNDWDANASRARLRNQCDVSLVGEISGKERNARLASSWKRSHHMPDGNSQLRIESSSLASVRTSMVPA